MKNQITALIANDAGEIFDVPGVEGVGRIGEQNFPRVRIGVGRPPQNWTVNHHVLSPFNQEDADKISAAIEELVPAVLCIFSEGINNAMNKFNPKKVKAHEQSDNSVDS